MMYHDTVDPMALLSDLLLDGDQKTTARWCSETAVPAVDALIRAGLLVPDGVVDAIFCELCDDHHEIVCGPPFTFHKWQCPKARFTVADPDAIRLYSITMSGAVAFLSNAFGDTFGRRRRAPRLLDDGIDAWIVGTWKIEGVLTTIVLARGLDVAPISRRACDLLVAQPQDEVGLVLTIGDDAGFEPPRRFASLPLADSMHLTDECRLSVVTDRITRAVRPQAWARLLSHAGRPSVEAQVFRVLDHLDACAELGDVTKGLSGIVARAWEQFYPGERAPARSTLRKHIASWRLRGPI